MVAGFGTFFKQEFGISNILGALIIITFSIIVFKKGIEGIEKINFILIPFIIFTILFLKYKTSSINFYYLEHTKNFSWLIKSILYASYNSIILIPILINLKNKINTKKEIFKICIGTFLITLLLSVSIFLLIQKNYYDLIYTQMPLITVAGRFGTKYKLVYSIVILTAIFTTAISSGYIFLKNVSKDKKQYKHFIYIISIIALILSPIGFGTLLDLLYPILGYLGLIQIIFMI